MSDSVAKTSLSIGTFRILRNSQHESSAIGTGRFHRCRLKMNVAFQVKAEGAAGHGDNSGPAIPIRLFIHGVVGIPRYISTSLILMLDTIIRLK